MPCSWKSMVLLALASIAIQYTALRTFSAKPLSLMCSVVHAVNGSLRDVTVEALDRGCNGTISHSTSSSSTNGKKRTHILILATTRSGSSFVGQLFNQNAEVRMLLHNIYNVHKHFRIHEEPVLWSSKIMYLAFVPFSVVMQLLGPCIEKSISVYFIFLIANWLLSFVCTSSILNISWQSSLIFLTEFLRIDRWSNLMSCSYLSSATH